MDFILDQKDEQSDAAREDTSVLFSCSQCSMTLSPLVIFVFAENYKTFLVSIFPHLKFLLDTDRHSSISFLHGSREQ
jgi:hypothetical protein